MPTETTIRAGQVWHTAGRNERTVEAIEGDVVINRWTGYPRSERTALSSFRAWVRKHNAVDVSQVQNV